MAWECVLTLLSLVRAAPTMWSMFQGLRIVRGNVSNSPDPWKQVSPLDIRKKTLALYSGQVYDQSQQTSIRGLLRNGTSCQHSGECATGKQDGRDCKVTAKQEIESDSMHEDVGEMD